MVRNVRSGVAHGARSGGARWSAAAVLALVLALCGCNNQPLSVTGTSPQDGETNVSLDAHVVVTFSSALDPASVAAGQWTIAPAHGATVSVDGATATLVPTGSWSASTQYTLTLSADAQDAHGKKLGADYALTFTTAAPASDTTAPAAVTDLAAQASAAGIALSWTAVGDDGSTGTATTVDLRQGVGSACPITAANFASATPVSGVPAPHPAGTAESFQVTGLFAKTPYCFAIKVSDEASNLSSLSNAVSATMPDVAAPASPVIAASVTTATSVQIRWTAVGDDGQAGLAAAQLLRYATGAACPLTADTFASGTPQALAAPQLAGSAESVTVTGLASSTDYCFLLQVSDAAGNAAYSNVLVQTTADGVAPAAAVLQLTAHTATSLDLRWTAVGDDGASGQATSQQLRMQTSAACASFNGTTFGSGTLVAGVGAPQPAGSVESASITGLAPDTASCFVLAVTDEAGNVSYSATLAAHTDDTLAPGTPALSLGTVTASSVELDWQAVGESGSTGTVSTEELRYAQGAACATYASASFASGTQVTLSAPQPPGMARTGTASSLPADADVCFLLREQDEAGNATFSNVLQAHTVDGVAPAAPVLAPSALGASSVTVSWTAVGDNGTSGTVASEQLRSQAGAACPGFGPATFLSGTILPLGAPQPAGAARSTSAIGLTADSDVCFLLSVADEVGNRTYSNVLQVHTVDAVAPSQPVLTLGTVTASAVPVSWTAVGDNGTSGTVSVEELRYATGASCSTFGSATFASGTQVSLAAPQPAGSPRSATASPLAADTDVCLILKVADEAGNSAFSAAVTAHTTDSIAPAAPLLTVSAVTASSLHLAWTAPGDNVTTGTVASEQLRYQTGSSCQTYNQATFASGTLVALPAPSPGGTAVSQDLTGLSGDTDYCFLLQEQDEAGNTSYSPLTSARTTDGVAPAQALLSSSAQTTTSVTVDWTEVGDNGNSGTATSEELRYATGAACASFGTGTFASGTQAALSGPQAPGTARSVTVSGLAADTDVCLLMQVADEAANSTFSNILVVHTVDAIAPSTPTLTGSTTDARVSLGWVAVGDNGGTGTATGYELVYAPISSGSCPADPSTLPGSTTLTSGGALPTPSAPGTSETATLTLSDLTRYCFALRVADEVPNFSGLSNVVDLTTGVTDVTAPSSTAIVLDTVGTRTIDLHFAASGDDGSTGAASHYELHFEPGPACAASFDFDTASNSADVTPAGPPPSAGTQVNATAGSLTPGSHLCLQLAAFDDAGNRALSPLVETDTPADTIAPAAIALAAPTPGTVGSTGATLSWTAVADDGVDPASGPVSSYVARYLVASAPGDCAGLDDLSFASATDVVAQPDPGAVVGASESHTLTFQPADHDKRFCVAVQAVDAVGNHSVAQWQYLFDDTPPATITTLAAARQSANAVSLSFTTVGDDGMTGTATSYEVRGSAGTCPADRDAFFASATPFAGMPAPIAAGQTQLVGIAGLSSGAWCVALEVFDDEGNVSGVSNLVSIPVDSASQIADLRTTIASQAGTPITVSPSAAVNSAVVTYTKAAVAGAAAGTLDGPGFFIQSPSGGAGLYVAIDPASAGLLVGDSVDLTVTGAAWLCPSGTCLATNSLYAVTAATLTRGAVLALPAAADLSSLDLTVPIGANWQFESARVIFSGVTGSFVPGAGGFTTAALTNGSGGAVQLRVSNAALQSSGLAEGCTVTVNGTPGWRSGTTAEVAAWTAADLSVSGCPTPAVTSVTPSGTGVDTGTQIVVGFNVPVSTADLVAQAGPGACVGKFQVSTSATFAGNTCIGIAAVYAGNFGKDVTLVPAGGVLTNTTYYLRTVGVRTGSLGAIPDLTPAAQFTTAAIGGTCASSATVVISQVYGGGGSTSTSPIPSYTHDWVELHNRGLVPVSLSGWSLQYQAAGTTGTVGLTSIAVLPNVSIGPGQYFLVRLGTATGATGATPPAPDFDAASGGTNAISMQAASAKIFLVRSTAPITPTVDLSQVVDFLGYGASANLTEGGTKTASTSTTTAALRAGNGCTDTNSNGADFTITAPAPRNGSTPPLLCSCQGPAQPVNNGVGTSVEPDRCALAAPVADVTLGGNQSAGAVVGRVLEAGVTDVAGADPSVVVQVGFGLPAIHPGSWSWTAAPWASQQGAEDEYSAALTAPTSAGSYRLGVRVSLDQGKSWEYCDQDGTGANPVAGFDPVNQLPQLIVQ